jgi:hypothetical protein
MIPAAPTGRYPALELGELPVDVINATLGTDLAPGRVRLSAAAHRHIAEDHPEDYPTCRLALPQAIADPTLIGQAPRHGRNFELIRRVQDGQGRAILVAIGLEPDDAGSYRVRSCYLISRNKVEARRQAGFLRVASRP